MGAVAVPDIRAGRRGVSPIIGAVLMVAIVVLLAAVLFTFAAGFDEELTKPAPTGSFEYEYRADGTTNKNHRPFVNLTYTNGPTTDADNILIKDDSGNTIAWSDVWTGGPRVEAGEYVHIDGYGSDSVLDTICERGDTYRIIVTNEAGDSLVVTEWSAPRDARVPVGSGVDTSPADGIPDECQP